MQAGVAKSVRSGWAGAPGARRSRQSRSASGCSRRRSSTVARHWRGMGRAQRADRRDSAAGGVTVLAAAAVRIRAARVHAQAWGCEAYPQSLCFDAGARRAVVVDGAGFATGRLWCGIRRWLGHSTDGVRSCLSCSLRPRNGGPRYRSDNRARRRLRRCVQSGATQRWSTHVRPSSHSGLLVVSSMRPSQSLSRPSQRSGCHGVHGGVVVVAVCGASTACGAGVPHQGKPSPSWSWPSSTVPSQSSSSVLPQISALVGSGRSSIWPSQSLSTPSPQVSVSAPLFRRSCRRSRRRVQSPHISLQQTGMRLTAALDTGLPRRTRVARAFLDDAARSGFGLQCRRLHALRQSNAPASHAAERAIIGSSKTERRPVAAQIDLVRTHRSQAASR